MRLVLFTRYPTPGKAKTRLIPAVGAEQAAAIHRRLTENTVQVLQTASQEAQTDARLEIHITGAASSEFTRWLGPLHFVQQTAGDLSRRLTQASEPAPVIFFGADTPDLTPAIVCTAIDALRKHQLVIGPAEDGGYYLIGFAQTQTELFADMPWGTERVFDETMRRAESQILSTLLLPTLSDCDRPADLARWPWLLP